MPDQIHELYETRSYPAMSHPLSDPAVSAVAAGMAGLSVVHPAGARILEIGCGSGHNLIPLAMRWPDSRFVGVDRSESAVRTAREFAGIAGLRNVEFRSADLLGFVPGGSGFDYIIAHGFLSWVPDPVKAALFDFCSRWLAPEGVATISFNLECGWRARFPVIEKARAIQQAGAGDEMASLEILRSVTEAGSPELAIIDDMLAKGPGILPFDDFGPVNDPCSLARFVEFAENVELRWLGESDPGMNVPLELGGQVLADLRRTSASFLDFQTAADALAGRTFRSALVCRDGASIAERISVEQMFKYSFRSSGVAGVGEGDGLIQSIDSFAPASVSLKRIMVGMESGERRKLAAEAFDLVRRGCLLARVEEVDFAAEAPEYPQLDAFRLECARRGLPLVDRWHQPCSFPERHFEVLAAMDGTLNQAGLAGFSQDRCPELAFGPWLGHLAGRGMFA